MRFVRALLVVVLALGLAYLGVLLVAFLTIPNHHGSEQRFDTLIVLGNPARADGTPAPELQARVDEAVREYKAGVAPRIIMTGAAAHNRWVEGQVMADAAVAEGVPRDAIVVEPEAKDTVQNIWYSRKLMQANGWHSAEVISSPYHLPRTALILEQYTGPMAMDWRTHASQWSGNYTPWKKLQKDWHEAVYCLRLRLHGFPPSKYVPAGVGTSIR